MEGSRRGGTLGAARVKAEPGAAATDRVLLKEEATHMNQAVCVKLEPEWESRTDSCRVSETATYTNHVKEPQWESNADSCEVSETAACNNNFIKKEPEWESSADSCRVSETGTYMEHVVKVEVVLEPEQIQSATDSIHCGELSTAHRPPAATGGPSTSEHDSLLQIHTNTLQHVSEKNTYICDTCGETFQQKQRLIRHVKVHLAKKSPLPRKEKKLRRRHKKSCKVCKKLYSKDYLKIHERTHTGEKPYSCEVCKKKFAVLGSLKDHKRLHTEERPYSCEICQKSFPGSSNLINHKKIHAGKKPFPCEVCKKEFTRPSHLKAHQRVHTGELYQCEDCDKGFTQLSHLKTHKLIHTGEKPFRCEVCNASFRHWNTLKDHLKRHNLTHDGEMRFLCNICNTYFRHWHTLKAHERTHSEPVPTSKIE